MVKGCRCVACKEERGIAKKQGGSPKMTTKKPTDTKAVKAEREACAKLAEEMPLTWKETFIKDFDYHGNRIAAAIRARGKK